MLRLLIDWNLTRLKRVWMWLGLIKTKMTTRCKDQTKTEIKTGCQKQHYLGPRAWTGTCDGFHSVQVSFLLPQIVPWLLMKVVTITVEENHAKGKWRIYQCYWCLYSQHAWVHREIMVTKLLIALFSKSHIKFWIFILTILYFAISLWWNETKM